MYSTRNDPSVVRGSYGLRVAGYGLCCLTRTGKGNLLFSSSPFAAGAVLVHAISHLVVSGILASLVYHCIGLAVLRRSWFNVVLADDRPGAPQPMCSGRAIWRRWE